MVGSAPAPENIALPVNFDYLVVDKALVGYVVVVEILMREDKRLAAVSTRISVGVVVAYGASLSLVVMVLTRHVYRLLAGVSD